MPRNRMTSTTTLREVAADPPSHTAGDMAFFGLLPETESPEDDLQHEQPPAEFDRRTEEPSRLGRFSTDQWVRGESAGASKGQSE